jgi:hypothetical protein
MIDNHILPKLAAKCQSIRQNEGEIPTQTHPPMGDMENNAVCVQNAIDIRARNE